MNHNHMHLKMKISTTVSCLLLFGMLVTLACSLTGIVTGKSITPSDVIISETRNVSDFTEIEMSTLGNIDLSQGSSESVTVTGNDNLVPLITTDVRDGVLYIDSTKEFNITAFSSDIELTYTIVVKDLSSLNLSGLGQVRMDSLTAPKFTLDISGGGDVKISQLTTDELSLTLSGAGTVELAGEAKQATIELSGAGEVKAADLKIQTASVKLPGLGSATLWVTDQLNGEISGAGSVSYYGNPQTDVSSSGLGEFKPLGNK